MKDFTNYIRGQVKEACYCSFGALVLLGLLQPFGIDQVQEGRLLFILAETLLLFVASLLTASILYLWPWYRRFEAKTLAQAFVGYVPFYLLLTPILSFLLVVFNFWHARLPQSYAWHDATGAICFQVYGKMCVSVLFIGVFIVIWKLYRFYTHQLKEELFDVRAINALLEERQARLEAASESNEKQMTEKQQHVCHLVGNAQHAWLDVCPDDIIYIESMANYADIVYITDGATQHTMLRITLKQLRESLASEENLVQCHRAFLVNLNFVRLLRQRSAGTYELELFGIDKKIPVSRTNAAAMRQLLEK